MILTFKWPTTHSSNIPLNQRASLAKSCPSFPSFAYPGRRPLDSPLNPFEMSSFKAFGHDYNDMFGRSVRNSLSGASGGEEQHDSPDNVAAAASSSSSSSIYQRARRSDNTASSRKAGRTLPSSSYPQTAASGAGARPRRPGQQLRNSKQITRPPDNAVALSAIPGAPDEDPFGGAVTPRRWVTTQKTSTPRGAQPATVLRPLLIYSTLKKLSHCCAK